MSEEIINVFLNVQLFFILITNRYIDLNIRFLKFFAKLLYVNDLLQTDFSM